MRKGVTQAGVTVNAIAGPRVVTLSLDISAAKRKGLRGFGILRTDRAEQETYRMRGTRTFESIEPHPAPGEQLLALLWQIFEGAGFPNQFFCDLWEVGILEGRPWILIGRAILRSGLRHSLARWETRRDRGCAQPMWRD